MYDMYNSSLYNSKYTQFSCISYIILIVPKNYRGFVVVKSVLFKK